jgi:hypothetical protein
MSVFVTGGTGCRRLGVPGDAMPVIAARMAVQMACGTSG